MSYADDYQKEQARRMARGEPLTNQEVIKNLDSAKQGILERGQEHGGTGSETLAKDVAGLVEKGKVFVQEKNPNQEIQKLQHAGKRFGKNAPNADQLGTAQTEYFDQMKERYDDLAELATKMAYSRGTRRIMRRLQTILLESLSSAAGQAEEKLDHAARQAEKKEKEVVIEGGDYGAHHNLGSESKSHSGVHEIPQLETKHTRSNYKVVIRGKEYDFLKDEDISEENKEWIAEEAQNICIDIASDDQLKDSASTFCRVLKSTSQIEIDKPELSPEATRALEDSKTHLKSLMDHMAEGYDWSRMEAAWHQLIDKTGRNDEMEHDWKDFFHFLKESFLSKRLAMSHDWTNNFNGKLEQLRHHLLSIKPELFNLIQEFDCFSQALKDDKFISETSASVDKLSKDLFLDNNGNFEFKPDALTQIRDIIVPEFIEQFKYIAIPTFREEDETHSSEISNAVFKSEGLSPDDVQIQNTTDIKLTRKDDNVMKTSVHVLIQGMKFDLQDMHVKYCRKVFPQLNDEGDFNIRSTGKGVKLELWLSANADNAEVFKVDDVDCTISGLRIYDSHVKEYTFLFSVFKPLLQTMLRKQVQNAIEEKIQKTAFSLKGLKSLSQ